jgi:putative membrane protein
MGPEHFLWGGWWPIPIVMPLAMVVIFVAMFYVAFGRGGSGPPRWNDSDRSSSHPKDSETAIEVLQKRYAKGEISREEFQQMKKDIQG